MLSIRRLHTFNIRESFGLAISGFSVSTKKGYLFSSSTLLSVKDKWEKLTFLWTLLTRGSWVILRTCEWVRKWPSQWNRKLKYNSKIKTVKMLVVFWVYVFYYILLYMMPANRVFDGCRWQQLVESDSASAGQAEEETIPGALLRGVWLSLSMLRLLLSALQPIKFERILVYLLFHLITLFSGSQDCLNCLVRVFYWFYFIPFVFSSLYFFPACMSFLFFCLRL